MGALPRGQVAAGRSIGALTQEDEQLLPSLGEETVARRPSDRWGCSGYEEPLMGLSAASLCRRSETLEGQTLGRLFSGGRLRETSCCSTGDIR